MHDTLLAPLRWLAPIYDALYWPVFYPLKLLYFFGPTLYGLGFWGGTPPLEICAALSNHRGELSALFADERNGLCDEMLETEFSKFSVMSAVLLYYGTVAVAVRCAWRSFVQHRNDDRLHCGVCDDCTGRGAAGRSDVAHVCSGPAVD